MTKLDRDEIVRLTSLTEVDYKDKTSCKAMIEKYISPGYSFCMTCDPAVRSAFKKLKNWWDSQTTQYQFIKTMN